MNGVWTPKRAPVAAMALSTLPADARANFDARFRGPTIAQRHLWVAASRGESLVVVTPRHSGGVGVLNGCVMVASGAGNQGGGPELPTAEMLAASDVLASEPLNLIVNSGFRDGLVGCRFVAVVQRHGFRDLDNGVH